MTSSLFSQQTNPFLDFLNAENYSEARNLFDAELKNVVSETKLKDTWGVITKSLGTIKSYQPNCEEQTPENTVQYTTCQFEKQTLDLKVAFNNKKEIIGFFIIPVFNCGEKRVYNLPNYSDTTKYKEKEVVIQQNKISLNGTLTIPTIPSASICIFVHGSGPNDRDESIGPNKPFKDIATGLASKGIASIRFDKRTFTNKTASDTISIEEEVTDDVLSVIDFISTNNDLKNKKIYLIGHSLGGMLLPKIIQSRPNVSGAIFLAANARSLEELILIQTDYLYKLDDGKISPSEQDDLNKLKSQINYLKDSISQSSPPDKLPLNLPPSYWISLKKYDQLKEVKKSTIPLFFLQGKRDYQVTTEDLNLWESTLKGHSNVKFQSYSKLNHLFLEGKGNPNPTEYNEPGNVPIYIIEDISKWMTNNR